MIEQRSGTISAPSRLHITLHDCGYATPRIFGGVGMLINDFPTEVQSTVSDYPELHFSPQLDPSDRARTEALALVERVSKKVGNVAVHVRSIAPEHKGFGSKTSMLLAITQSAFLAHGYEFGERKNDIVGLTGRGGTSGIGINGFWKGGLIVDGGHSSGKERQFLPSSRRQPMATMAPLIARHDLPSDWQIQLFYDETAPLIEGEKEKSLFQKLMPFSDNEIHTTMAATFHGVIPAVIEGDVEAFGSALATINQTGMKKAEVDCQSPLTKQFLNKAWADGLAAGLTSFGPTVFGVSRIATPEETQLESLALSHDLTSLGTHSFNNTGAVAS